MNLGLSFRARRLMLRMLSRLSVKMAIFFAAIFALATVVSVIGTRITIEHYAEHSINSQMSAGSAVFERIANMQFEQLDQASRALTADSGFRAAAATGDTPKIGSALTMSEARLKLADAFFVARDGAVTGLDMNLPARDQARLFGALESGAEQGVANLGGSNRIVTAAPVENPVRTGWVVFIRDLGPNELGSLSRLAVIDLHPKVTPVAALPGGVGLGEAATEKSVAGERWLFRATPVRGFIGDEQFSLLLTYSLTAAMNGYQPIFSALLLFGLLGIALFAGGSFILARRLSRPIAELERATRSVGSGEHAQVSAHSHDEISRLARSFNRMVHDIEDREAQIAHMAFHDALTGLANRSLLREHVIQQLKSAEHKSFALLCLDLDNFKAINDTLGHPTGDAVLCEIAVRLQQVVGHGFVARLGGDEFAIFAEGDVRSISVLCRAILAQTTDALLVNGHRIIVGNSIGVAMAPQDGADPVKLLKNADLALYRAKSDGKGAFRFFENAMDAEAQKRRAVEVDLHDAVRNGELELFFQPLFDLSQNRVTAFEALLRWNHPKRGLVSPADFIPLAEDTGLIVPIGEWVLREACRIAATWPAHIRVAVNISPVQFRSNRLNSVVMQSLTSSKLDPRRLELEITESLFMDHIETTLASLHSLRALGVRIALDDFGTGYSSLTYLRSFPFDKIKIDRSFIEDLLAHEGATAIIRSITSLAEALGMETTAEGVETIDQLDILREHGCNQIQGYYFSKPVPASDVSAMFGQQAQPLPEKSAVVSDFGACLSGSFAWTPDVDVAQADTRQTGAG